MKNFIKLLPVLVGVLILVSVPVLYFLRAQITKPLVLALQHRQSMEERGSDPPADIYPDGTKVEWYEDDYTKPSIRCYSQMMHDTHCIMVWEDEQPCEKQIKKVCNFLFPDP
jgi:hypothetical protein